MFPCRCKLYIDIHLHLKIANSKKYPPYYFANKKMFVFLRTTNKKGDIKVKTKQYTEEQEQMARFAKAMGHPARMAILSFLAKQESCFFGDIHEELPIAKATVSQHLKELKEAGLIQGEIETPKVRYCINRENWELARKLFTSFLGDCKCTGTSCCG